MSFRGRKFFSDFSIFCNLAVRL